MLRSRFAASQIRNPSSMVVYPASGLHDATIQLAARFLAPSNLELLTPNQHTGTDTLGDTTGFKAIAAVTTISSSTEQAHTGTRSLKVTTPGNTIVEGTKTTNLTVEPLTTYTGSAWVYAPLNANLIIGLTDDINTHSIVSFIGTGTWQYVTVNITTDAHTTINLVIRNAISAQNITFYVDDLSLKKIVPINGKTINFTVNGTNAGSATTNASGVATLPYTINLNAGTYPITATFAGDEVYAATTDTDTLTVSE